MSKFLDTTGVTKLWNKVKNKLDLKADKTDIKRKEYTFKTYTYANAGSNDGAIGWFTIARITSTEFTNTFYIKSVANDFTISSKGGNYRTDAVTLDVQITHKPYNRGINLPYTASITITRGHSEHIVGARVIYTGNTGTFKVQVLTRSSYKCLSINTIVDDYDDSVNLESGGDYRTPSTLTYDSSDIIIKVDYTDTTSIVTSGGIKATEFLGNATTASKLSTPRKIKLKGKVEGEANFDGSDNININTTLNGDVKKESSILSSSTVYKISNITDGFFVSVNGAFSDGTSASELVYIRDAGSVSGLVTFFPRNEQLPRLHYYLDNDAADLTLYIKPVLPIDKDVNGVINFISTGELPTINLLTELPSDDTGFKLRDLNEYSDGSIIATKADVADAKNEPIELTLEGNVWYKLYSLPHFFTLGTNHPDYSSNLYIFLVSPSGGIDTKSLISEYTDMRIVTNDADSAVYIQATDGFSVTIHSTENKYPYILKLPYDYEPDMDNGYEISKKETIATEGTIGSVTPHPNTVPCTDNNSEFHFKGLYTEPFANIISSPGWFRVYNSNLSSATGDNIILSIRRNFSTTINENYIFSISVINNLVNITQLSGIVSSSLIPKIRVLTKHNSKFYIDLYYEGTLEHTVAISGIGSGVFMAPVLSGDIPGGYVATEFNTGTGIINSNGIVSNKLKFFELTNQDLNSYRTESNFIAYYAAGTNTCTNKPTGVTYFSLQVLKLSDSRYCQILTDNNGITYKRSYLGAGWTEWKKILTESDVNTTRYTLSCQLSSNEGSFTTTSVTLRNNKNQAVQWSDSLIKEAVRNNSIVVELNINQDGNSMTITSIPSFTELSGLLYLEGICSLAMAGTRIQYYFCKEGGNVTGEAYFSE